jgi:hypothetical protein
VPEVKAPAKTCISDATIAAIYSHAEDMVQQEIDAGTVKFRRLIAQVIPESAPRPQCTRPYAWLRYIDSLLDCVLDDRDYLLEEDIVDAAPEQATKLREALGIEDDYFTHTAPNPTEERVRSARQTLARILGASWEE